jgi:hypothetical protein
MQRLFGALLLVSAAVFGQLPGLKIEATDGGSVMVVKNLSTTQPMTAYLIELVDYPGSSFAFSQDEIATGGKPLGPGEQRRIPILNMTVGAAPDYMKVMAAVFADGSSAGEAQKVAEILERRKLYLATVRDLIGRISKGATAADLRKWADSILESTSKTKRAKPEVLNPAMVRGLVADTAHSLASRPPAEVVKSLQATDAAISASKPPTL